MFHQCSFPVRERMEARNLPNKCKTQRLWTEMAAASRSALPIAARPAQRRIIRKTKLLRLSPIYKSNPLQSNIWKFLWLSSFVNSSWFRASGIWPFPSSSNTIWKCFLNCKELKQCKGGSRWIIMWFDEMWRKVIHHHLPLCEMSARWTNRPKCPPFLPGS